MSYDPEALEALEMLGKLARERGLTRLSELGDLPPFGTPEWDRWVEEHPPILRVAGAEETAS